MSIYESIILIGIMATLAIVPSASVALVIARTAALGIANGIAVSAGIVLGDLVFIGLAIWGLSAVVEGMGSLFVLVKLLGGLYLIWFGYCLLSKDGTTKAVAAGTYKKGGLVASFMAGFILTLGDIKAIVFYASLLPLFIDVSTIQSRDVVLIALIMIFSVGGVKVAYAILANKVAAYTQRANMGSKARKAAGGLLACAGGYLIVKA